MADVDLKLSERAGSAATCVFCKEPLGAASVSCPGCGVGLHTACRDEVSRCPTLGCRQTWERRAGVVAAARTQATPIEGFRPIIRGTGERGPELTGESSKLRLLALLLFALFVAAFVVIEAVEYSGARRRDDALASARERAARVAEETRRAEDRPAADAVVARMEAIGAANDHLWAGPLNVAGQEEKAWRAGRLEAFDRHENHDPGGEALLGRVSTTRSANGLTINEARWLMAGLRQRVLAALPPEEADAWARQGAVAVATARCVFDRIERGVKDGRPFEDSSRAALEYTIHLGEVRADAVDLSVRVTDNVERAAWRETWPRTVDPALRLSVLKRSEDPSTTVVLQRVSRHVRAITAVADGVTLQVFHQDGLPLPWHATLTRDVDGQRSYRVEFELLTWSSWPPR